VVTAVLLAMMALMPLMGWISDRVGRKPVMMFSYGLGALVAVPVLSALASTTDPIVDRRLADPFDRSDLGRGSAFRFEGVPGAPKVRRRRSAERAE
jgi:MFS family permease